MKRFNLTGLCIPARHYMVDLTDKVNQIMRDYIDQGAYFTINRARQFGKTTLINALETHMQGKYTVISISFEAADEYFVNQQIFVNGIVMDIAEALERAGVDEDIVKEWDQKIEGDYPLKMLSRKISNLCKKLEKNAILMIDEVDKSSDNQIFLNFLGMLRDKYLKREKGMDTTFQSVILAGVYDVKNLKLKIRPDEERKYNSPWNIAADFCIDMSFSINEIAKMLMEYSVDTGIEMDFQGISEKIYFYTNGYPFLVSWICKWIDETGSKAWTIQNVENAENELLKSDNTLFDDMIKNVENNRELKDTITGMLFDGLRIPFIKSDFVVNLGILFGIFIEKRNTVNISNIIFETYLYNHIIAGKIRKQGVFEYEKNQFIENGQLNMERALNKFQEIMKAEYRDENEDFIERQGRLLFLCFMKPIINGRRNYYVEPETRNNTRMDVVISYGGQKHIVELKIWHGQQDRQKGIEQLETYLESRNCDKGYLISFSFQKNKEYIRKVVILERSKKEVYEIVV